MLKEKFKGERHMKTSTKLTVREKILKYLRTRKTGITSEKLALKIGANYNTVRKELGYLIRTDKVWAPAMPRYREGRIVYTLA